VANGTQAAMVQFADLSVLHCICVILWCWRANSIEFMKYARV